MTNQPSLANRRFFLKAAGVTLALPLLESLTLRRAGTGLALETRAGAAVGERRPLRMVCIGNMLGYYAPAFFPKNTGKDYDLPLLLEPLAPHREQLTLFSGLDHGVKGGHFAIHAFLTASVRSIEGNAGRQYPPRSRPPKRWHHHRFSSLAVGSEDGIHGGCQMCWTRSGTAVPPIPTPRELFRKLFINENQNDRDRAADRFRLQGSILDAVQGDAPRSNAGLVNRIGKSWVSISARCATWRIDSN